MKREHLFLIGALIVTVALLLFAFADFLKGQSVPLQPAKISTSGFQAITSGTTESGSVAIEVTPQGISDGEMSFLISANTHSVDLGQFDLKAIAILEYEGKSSRPLSAPPLSEHHASGALVFPVEGKPSKFTLVITGIPNVEKRVFAWG